MAVVLQHIAHDPRTYYINYVPGPAKEPKIMAQYLKIESVCSIGSIILPILEVQVGS